LSLNFPWNLFLVVATQISTNLLRFLSPLALISNIIYLQGSAVCWRSKAKKGVTLKCVTISDAVKEIKFLYFLFQDIGIEVNLSIASKTDNVGALVMSQNSSTAVRT
jgi:hypothetical protein